MHPVAGNQKRHLNTFRGLTIKNVNMNFPESEEKQKGHMKQQHQGTYLTEPKPDESTEQHIKLGTKQCDMYLCIFDAIKKAMYTGQMGKFPVTSSCGNKYLMVAVKMDGKYINAKPMKSLESQSLVKAYSAIMERWKATKSLHPTGMFWITKCQKS